MEDIQPHQPSQPLPHPSPSPHASRTQVQELSRPSQIVYEPAPESIPPRQVAPERKLVAPPQPMPQREPPPESAPLEEYNPEFCASISSIVSALSLFFLPCPFSFYSSHLSYSYRSFYLHPFPHFFLSDHFCLFITRLNSPHPFFSPHD